jgi:hypothetical protein
LQQLQGIIIYVSLFILDESGVRNNCFAGRADVS